MLTIPEEKLLEQLDPEDLRRSIQRRRDDSQSKTQSRNSHPSDSGSAIGDDIGHVQPSPQISTYCPLPVWQDAAIDYQCQPVRSPQNPMEVDVGFWTSFAAWNEEDIFFSRTGPGTNILAYTYPVYPS